MTDPEPPAEVPADQSISAKSEESPQSGAGPKDNRLSETGRKLDRSLLRNSIVRGLSGICVVVAALYLTVPDRLYAVYDNVIRATKNHWDRDSDFQSDVAITVASPSIHTRERLLNDRFEQLAWLEEQLKHANIPLAKKDLIDKRNSDKGGEKGEVSKDKETEKASQTNSFGLFDDYSIDVGRDNPLHDFEVTNGYRDMIRAERAVTMLDDHHDIDDNTIYLFSFDTSIVPDPYSQGYAAVEATVTRDENDLESDLDDNGKPGYKVAGQQVAADRLKRFDPQDYFDIYLNWLERLRRLEDLVVRSAAFNLNHSPTNLPPNLQNLVSTLEIVACSEWLAFKKGKKSAEGTAQDESECRRAQDALSKRQNGVAEYDEVQSPSGVTALEEIKTAVSLQEGLYNNQAKADYNKQIVPNLGDFIANLREIERNVLAKDVLDSGTRLRIEEVISNNQSATSSYEEAVSECSGRSAHVDKDVYLYDLIERYVEEGNRSWRHTKGEYPGSPLRTLRAECPRIFTYAERARYLYWLIGVTQSRILLGSGSRVVEGPPLDPKTIDVSSTCITALWVREQANANDASSPRNHGASLTEFFKFRVLSLADGSCRISIEPAVSSLRNMEGVPPRGHRHFDIYILHHLQDLLEGPGYSDRDFTPVTKAFSYGLSPRLREHLAARGDESLKADAGLLGSVIGVGQDEQVTAETTEPEVVGFTRSAESDRHVSSGARFGWLVAPRPEVTSPQAPNLPVQQVQLGALVAVPSWWRTALLEICTSFAKQKTVAHVAKSDFWHSSARCRVEPIRLPGTAADVPRHLGMDVLTYPYVVAPTLDDGSPVGGPVIFADDKKRPASLLIQGERLWRSTVVTLGGQKQDNIEVLPDMSGITATFACVDVPTITNGLIDLQSDTDPSLTAVRLGYWVYNVPVVVWTSEGHSEELQTKVAVRREPSEESGAEPCHPSEMSKEKNAPKPVSASMSVQVGKTTGVSHAAGRTAAESTWQTAPSEPAATSR